ncbi:MAG: hypothetical protein QMC78_03425 [Methanocellales archaeon]|nr:hypothetical protein [Methanocellales archaeon]
MNLAPCSDPECIFYKPVVPPVPVIYEQTITDAPGMDEYRWYNQDFGWTHTFDPTGKEIISAKLEIRAWNVDWGEPWYMEHDIIYSSDSQQRAPQTIQPPPQSDTVKGSCCKLEVIVNEI